MKNDILIGPGNSIEAPDKVLVDNGKMFALYVRHNNREDLRILGETDQNALEAFKNRGIPILTFLNGEWS